MLNQTSPFAEDIHATLMSVVDLITSYRWIAIARYPHASEIVRMDPIVYELPQPVLMHVYAPRLAMMYLTMHYSGVGACLHFETSNAIVVNVVRFEKPLQGERLGVRLEQLLFHTLLFSSRRFCFSQILY